VSTRAQALKARVKATPVLGGALVRGLAAVRIRRFRGSATYWEDRYSAGGTSGAGSYGHLATFKAEVLNRIVAERGVASVLELGCGDGAQLSLAGYPSYLGLDVSPTAVRMCMQRFEDDHTKSFFAYEPTAFSNHGAVTADLTLSLDVLYHLVEIEVWELHLRHLFGASGGLVAIYAVDQDLARVGGHLLHRRFTPWVEANLPSWKLVDRIANPYPYDPARPDEGSLASFFLYERLRSQP
jgi:SAM-dependent methyltransferase